MANVHGEIPEPRIVGARQERTGVAVLTVAIPMVLRLEASGLKYPVPTSYPTIPGYGFAGAQGKEAEGGCWEWELTYEGEGPLQKGGAANDNEDQTVYALDTSDAEVPFTSHPDLIRIWKKGYGYLEDNRLIFPAKLPKGAEVDAEAYGDGKKNPFYGLESFLSIGAVWTKTYSATTLPADLFTNIGCIVATIPQPKHFKIPKIGKGRNWMKRGPGIRIRGSVAELTERYLLSGRGGHNKDVYREETQ
jgi:hypothetical protein